MQSVRCLRGKRVTDWDLVIPQIASAIRSTVNRSTGYTPNKLMLGREVFKPVDLVFGLNQQYSKSSTVSDYVAELEERMRFSHQIARENLDGNIKINKRDYDKKVFQTKYEVGDLVYLRDDSVKKGISKKIETNF